MSLTDSMRIIDAPNDNTYWNDDSSSDTEPKRCAEPGCTNAVATTPTGRKAKYCIEHKLPANRSGAPTVKRGSRKSTWPEREDVRASLLQLCAFTGGALTVINKADGAIVLQGGPNIVNALIDLAETDKQVRRYLNFMSKPGKYGALVLATAGVVIPILANHGLLPTFLVDLSGQSVGATDQRGGETE